MSMRCFLNGPSAFYIEQYLWAGLPLATALVAILVFKAVFALYYGDANFLRSQLSYAAHAAQLHGSPACE